MTEVATAEARHGNIATERLKSIVERIERLEEEKKVLGEDIKDIYAEAKGAGFDVKALRALIKERKQDADDRAEQEAMLELYRASLG